MGLLKRKPNAVAVKFTGRQTRIRVGNSIKSVVRSLQNTERRAGLEGVIFFRKVTVTKKGKKKNLKKTLLLVEKKFNKDHPLIMHVEKESRKRIVKTIKFNPVEEQFRILNVLRQIPSVKEHIPPTVRLLKRKGKTSLLITDLTEGGTYFVQPNSQKISNSAQLFHEMDKIQSETFRLHRIVLHPDSFLIQVDKKTMKGIKIWIVDAGQIVGAGQIERSII